MTKINFNTSNIAVINSELSVLYSSVNAAKNYAGSISAPGGFRAGDIANAVKVLSSSTAFVSSTISWINNLKTNYENFMSEENAKIKLIEEPLYKENSLIVK